MDGLFHFLDCFVYELVVKVARHAVVRERGEGIFGVV